MKAEYKRDYRRVRAEEETSRQVLYGKVCVPLLTTAMPQQKEEENDIFKNVKALVKKRTGLAVSYSRLLFSPFLLARKETEELYKSLTPSSTTHLPFLSVLDPRLQNHRRTGKVTVCWKNSPQFPPPAWHTTYPRALSFGFILQG
jgi:hypothetical protein